MGQSKSVVSWICSPEFLSEFESYLEDSTRKREAQQYMEIIAKKIATHLISKDPLPQLLFTKLSNQIEFYTQRDQVHSLACTGKLIFKDFVDIIKNFNARLNTMQILDDLKIFTGKLCSFSAKCGLPLVDFAFMGLAILLQQDETSRMKKYVDKVADALEQKMDLKRLKDALNDLRTKLKAIQKVFFKINGEDLEADDKRALILALVYPLEEIYQKIIEENSIYQEFSVYTFETIICFFILELGIIKTAKDQFGLDLSFGDRCTQYPEILEKYLWLMSAQRQKLRHKNGSFLINTTMTNLQLQVSETRRDPDKSFLKGNILRSLSVEDQFTGKLVFCLDCIKSSLSRFKCYYFTFDLVYNKNLFYDAYKEKFRDCLALFEKANMKETDIA